MGAFHTEVLLNGPIYKPLCDSILLRKNIILRDAQELRGFDDTSIYLSNSQRVERRDAIDGTADLLVVERHLQQVLIPGERVVKILCLD